MEDNKDIKSVKNNKKSLKLQSSIFTSDLGLYLFLLVGMIFVFIALWGYLSPMINSTSWIIEQSNNKPTTTKNIEKIINTDGTVKVQYPEYGTKYATLQIPSAGISKPIYFGDTKDELAKGVGHFSGSYLPGEGGTIIFSGHNNNVFKDLGKVAMGDKVIIEANYGTFEYKISFIKIVKTSETQYLQLNKDKESLVMYTCYPFSALGLTSQRFLVIADRV